MCSSEANPPGSPPKVFPRALPIDCGALVYCQPSVPSMMFSRHDVLLDGKAVCVHLFGVHVSDFLLLALSSGSAYDGSASVQLAPCKLGAFESVWRAHSCRIRESPVCSRHDCHRATTLAPPRLAFATEAIALLDSVFCPSRAQAWSGAMHPVLQWNFE